MANPRTARPTGRPTACRSGGRTVAPGVSDAAQLAQVAPASAVPQLGAEAARGRRAAAGQRDVLEPSGVGASGEAGGSSSRSKLHRGDDPLAAEARARRPARPRDSIRSGDCRPAARSARPSSPPACRPCRSCDEIGLRDDADQRAALVDDRDAAHLFASHQRPSRRSTESSGPHVFTPPDMTSLTGASPSRPSATARMAMSRSVTTPTRRPRVSARRRARRPAPGRRPPPSSARGLRHRRVRGHGARILRHDLGDLHRRPRC